MTVAVLDREPVMARESEHDALHRMEYLFEHSTGSGSGAPRLMGSDGSVIELPESVFRLLRRVVHHLSEGQVVTLVPVNKELTTQEAANILNVSRPYLVKLLERGEIPYTKTGTHRRVRFSDLMAYKRERDDRRSEGLDVLTRMSEDLGLYDR